MRFVDDAVDFGQPAVKVVQLDPVADRNHGVRTAANAVDLGGLFLECLTVALFLHQRETQHIVGLVIDADSAVETRFQRILDGIETVRAGRLGIDQ